MRRQDGVASVDIVHHHETALVASAVEGAYAIRLARIYVARGHRAQHGYGSAVVDALLVDAVTIRRARLQPRNAHAVQLRHDMTAQKIFVMPRTLLGIERRPVVGRDLDPSDRTVGRDPHHGHRIVGHARHPRAALGDDPRYVGRERRRGQECERKGRDNLLHHIKSF